MLVGKDQHAQASGRGRGREENLKQAEACGNIITGLHRDARGNLTVVTVTSRPRGPALTRALKRICFFCHSGSDRSQCLIGKKSLRNQFTVSKRK
jgi:hypothetical protein